MSSGMSSLWRWMCSATGRILSSAKRRNVSCTSSKSSSRWRGPAPVDRGQERRVAVGGDEGAGAVERAGLDAPRRLAAEELGGQVGDGVGDEGAGDAGLVVALGAVVEQRAGGLDRGGGVGEVVGEDLVGVDRPGGGEVAPAPCWTTSRAGRRRTAAASRSGALMAQKVDGRQRAAHFPDVASGHVGSGRLTAGHDGCGRAAGPPTPPPSVSARNSSVMSVDVVGHLDLDRLVAVVGEVHRHAERHLEPVRRGPRRLLGDARRAISVMSEARRSMRRTLVVVVDPHLERDLDGRASPRGRRRTSSSTRRRPALVGPELLADVVGIEALRLEHLLVGDRRRRGRAPPPRRTSSVPSSSTSVALGGHVEEDARGSAPWPPAVCWRPRRSTARRGRSRPHSSSPRSASVGQRPEVVGAGRPRAERHVGQRRRRTAPACRATSPSVTIVHGEVASASGRPSPGRRPSSDHRRPGPWSSSTSARRRPRRS